MKSTWGRVVAACPITWQFFVWTSLGLMVLGPSILVSNAGGEAATWRSVFAVTLLLEGLLTFLLGLLVLRGRRISDAPILSWSVILLLSIAFPVLFRIVSLDFFHISSFQPGALRYFTAGTIWMLTMLLFAVAINETRQFRSDLENLQSQLRTAQELEKNEQSNLVRLRARVLSDIQTSLRVGFNKVATNSIATEAGIQLHSLVDEVVRPLASSLSERQAEGFTALEVEHAHSENRVRFSSLFARLGDINPFDYKVMPVAMVFSTLFMKTWLVSWGAAVSASFVSWAVSTALLFSLRHFFNGVRRKLGQKATVTFVFISLLCVALTDAACSRLVMGLEPSPSVLAMAFTEFGVLVLLAILRGIPVERVRLLAQIENVISLVNVMNSRLGQLIWLEKNRLAKLVHGDVQARIVATMLEINLLNKSGQQLQGQIEELRKSCETALLRPMQDSPLMTFLESLREIWAASIRIEIEVTKQALAIIDADPVAKDAISEIVRESITNAAKHGLASFVWVKASVTLNEFPAGVAIPNFVQLEILNDGVVIPHILAQDSSYSRGQGTTIFDQLCTEWSLGSENGLTTLTATVPVWITAGQGTR